MKNIVIDTYFDVDPNDERSQVIELIPNTYHDYRGRFTEVYKNDKTSECWLVKDNSWIKQINRSFSRPLVMRGFHMQKDEYCQGKLVSCIQGNIIYDCIIDVRKWSKTFGLGKVYTLDPLKANQLWVPRGFLHGFITGNTLDTQSIFEYCCDNVYNKEAEICINPQSVPNNVINNELTTFFDVRKMDYLLSLFKYNVTLQDIIISDKDLAGQNYLDFINLIKN